MKTLVSAVVVFGFASVAPVQSPAVMTANSTSAAVTLRTIVTAQITYSVSCGNGGYASTLKALATPPKGSSEAFIPKELKPEQPERNGYQFVLTAGAKAAAGPADCNGNKTVTKFYAAATPLKAGVTGTRSFAVNDDGTIWVLDGGVAPKEPFGPPAKPLTGPAELKTRK